jgi:8-oxo-dGTP diphosphatase
VTKIRPEVCVGAVVCRGDQILLIKRGNPPQKGRWSLPGGRVEPGERLVDAVAREVLEETGVAVVVGPFLEAVERLSDEFHFVILDYLATPVDLTAEPVAATDAADARWVRRVELGLLENQELLADQLFDFLDTHNLGASS